MDMIIIMSSKDLNCYITKMFFENTIPNKSNIHVDNLNNANDIKVVNFEKENMMILKKTQICSKDRHDKIIMTINPPKPIVSFSNNFIYDNGTIDMISKVPWETLEITEYNFNSVYVILFYQNGVWYISHDDNIGRLDDDSNLYSRVLKNLFTECKIENWDNSNFTYHLMLTHPSLAKITQHDIKSITLLWMCDNNINIINENNSVFHKNLKYFSCLDELQISMEVECNNDMLNRSLSFGGYFIKIPHITDGKLQYICTVLRSNLYKHILSMLPKNDNKYVSYLELYQRNELSDVIVYVHKYPNDVIRRINMAIRTLSKEILNIYHLTRKRQNFLLYNSLTKRYKKVLFELHKIYVTQKHIELGLKQSKHENLLIEKKSISVDVVYDYLKAMNVNDLIQIFKDRTEIIENLTKDNFKLDNIFNLNDIYIITQIELMFNKN